MIKPLTSLRAFFALWVFLSHLSFIKDDELLGWLHSFFFEGFLGVSFFFMLSGFVLSYAYSEKIQLNQISKRDYIWARIARIYPLHLITAIIALPVFLYANLKNGDYLQLLVIPVNISLIQSWIPHRNVYFSLNAPSWSISNEFFFYLLFPYLTLKLTNNKLNLVVALLFILAPTIIHLMPESQMHALIYINPLFRLSDFILGIFVYSLYRSKRLDPRNSIAGSWYEVGVVAVFMSFIFFHEHVPIAYRYSFFYWLPMLFIILVFSYSKGFLSKFISHKAFILLGEISFAFYLIHYQVIQAYQIVINKLPFAINSITAAVLLLIISGICAYILHFYVEVPLNQKLKNWVILRNSSIRADLSISKRR